MASEHRLRFRIRKGDYEVELEGEFEYVKTKFEELLSSSQYSTVAAGREDPTHHQPVPATFAKPSLTGIVERTVDGRPHMIVPVDILSAKEAIGLLLYAEGDRMLDHSELSALLGTSWKTTGESAVRARASELRREGRLIAEHGKYRLSGAGVQWLEAEVLPKLRRTAPTATQTTVEVLG